MIKAPKIISTGIFITLVLFTVVNFAKPPKNKIQQQNHPPVVKIISPKKESSFAANTQVSYAITVSDKEDGESKYDEINTKEVLLEVKYVKDSAQAAAEGNKVADAPGLAFIRLSNCFNCHSFNSKLIGPSLYDISKKYPATPANVALLVKRVREGATGVWGKISMPTHPELSKEQIQNMVSWILQNAANPGISYYIGTEGNFRIKPPVETTTKGSYVLTASYIDHGYKEDTTKHLKGLDVIVIRSR